MLKKLIFTGAFLTLSLIMSAQDVSVRDLSDGTDTPDEVNRNYELLLSKKDIDNTNNSFDDNVIVDDSVYIRRLYTLPTKMELVFNSAVKTQIELYATKRKRQVSYMLGQGKYYFPMFEEALDKEGLPLELKYLPVIESALNPIARSRAGATGLWQFIATTGKMYDLEVNSLVDERCDPRKSSEAAAKYLKYLYGMYGDWNLVIAAYNCGPGNVTKAIRRSGGQTDYWAIYPYLPKETRGYVPIFIAATYIMNYYREHNISPGESINPLSMDSVVINQKLHFQQIADIIDVSVEDLRQFNPQFKTDVIPGDYKGYSLNLPIKKLGDFIQRKDTIFAHRATELLNHRKVAGVDIVEGGGSGKSLTYRVKRGDTMARIASNYGVTSSQIKQWNGLSSSKLSTGRVLKIYKNPEPVEVAVEQADVLAVSNKASSSDTTVVSISGLTKTVSVPQTTTSYYKISKKDSWATIAKKNGVTVDDLKSWNSSVKSNKLVAGKQLKIQKIEYVQIQEAVVLPEPVLATVIIDSTYTTDLIDGYLKKITREESTLPRIRISATDSDEPERKSTDDTKIIYHKVKIGETIPQIAARYNVDQKDIIAWNKLKSNMAKVGQRLLILLPEENLDQGTSSDNTQANTNTSSISDI